jgi:hypothetical protein
MFVTLPATVALIVIPIALVDILRAGSFLGR